MGVSDSWLVSGGMPGVESSRQAIEVAALERRAQVAWCQWCNARVRGSPQRCLA
jgi:hypothetical protein